MKYKDLLVEAKKQLADDMKKNAVTSIKNQLRGLQNNEILAKSSADKQQRDFAVFLEQDVPGLESISCVEND